MARAAGQISTSAGTEAAVASTAYTEPTSGAQRSLASGSANDTALGTGARQVRITYYTLGADGSIAGPFVEVVTLNGVTAVPTVATNIALIEKLEIVAAGSGGVAAGIITLFGNNAGAGGTVWTIAAAARQTLGAHHYVASKKQCRVSDFCVSGGDPVAAVFSVRSAAYVAGAVSPELELTGGVGANNAAGAGRELVYPSAQPVLGPARLRAYVTPANANAQVSIASFGFVDTVVSF